MLANWIGRAIKQSPFISHTVDVVKQDGTSALPEERKADSSGTCFVMKGEESGEVYIKEVLVILVQP